MKSSAQRWLVLIGLLLFGGILFYAGPEAWQQILRADPRYLLLAFAVNLLLMTSSSIRWGLLTNTVVGEKVCTYFNYFYYLVFGRILGFFVSFNLGEYAVRPLALRATNSLSTGRMLYALALDKLFDLLLALALLGPALLFLVGRVSITIYLLSVCVVGAVLFLLWIWYDRLLKISLRFCLHQGQWLLQRSQKATRWLELLTSGEGLIGRRVITEAYGLTLLRFVLLTLYHYLVSTALHLPFAYFEFWMVVPIAQLSLIAGFTPGAVGILEVGWLGALTLLGADQSAVTAFVVGQRVFLLLLTLPAGLLISPWLLIAKKSQVGQEMN